MKNTNDIKKLSNKALTNTLEKLRSVERSTTLEILLYLIEIEDRKLHLELGYSSMFSFCTEKLGYSESEAGRRIIAARCIHSYPKVYRLLCDGEVNLSTVSTFAGILTSENAEEVLCAVCGKSRSEVQEYVARYRPRVTRPKESIKPIVVKAKPKKAETAGLLFSREQEKSGSSQENHSRCGSDSSTSKQKIKTLFDIRFSADEGFMEKFNEVKRVLSGKYPMGVSTEDLFREVMECFLKQKSPKERQARREKRVRKPKSISPSKKDPRTAGVVLKDLVFKRDGYQCVYVGLDGKRCGCTVDLEVDHILPWAVGGRTGEENLRTLCAAHNRFLGEKRFGRPYVTELKSV